MNHWNLFKESWRIFWRNPALWVFGLLAALGGGFNLRSNFNFNFNTNTNFDPEFWERFGAAGQPMPEMPFEFRALLNQIFSSQALGTIIVIGIVWAILAFLLATYADGALMGMVNTIGGGQKASVGFGFRAGAKRFLPLLAVRFVLVLPTLILAIITGIIASQLVFSSVDDFGPEQIFSRTFTAISGLGALSFVVGLLMMAIGISAERAVVIDELPIWPSIVKGWKFLWGKFGDYFTIVLLLIGVAILAGIIFACILTPILCGTMGTGRSRRFWRQRHEYLHAHHGLHRPDDPHRRAAGLAVRHAGERLHSSVWTLAYRQWTQPAQPAEAALQPAAPPIEPIPPIEPPASPNPSTIESPPEDKA